jgi:hypothetical protein
MKAKKTGKGGVKIGVNGNVKATQNPTGRTGGTNSKVSSQKYPGGRIGGTSTAPKTAMPKLKMGGSMRKKC